MAFDRARIRRLRVTLTSLVLVVGVLLAARWGFERLAAMKQDPAREVPEAVRTAVRVLEVERKDHREILGGYGQVEALHEAVISAEISSVVERVAEELRVGRSVTTGTELVWLNDEDQQKAVSAAEAALERSRATLARFQGDVGSLAGLIAEARDEERVARKELADLRSLEQTSTSSRKEVNDQVMAVSRIARIVLELEQRLRSTEALLAETEAEIKVRNADLLRARKDLSRTVVRSPFDGVVDARNIEKGARVGPGTPLFRLVDVQRVAVAITLGASAYGEVQLGAEVALRQREEGPVVWRGPIVRRSASLNREERTFRIYAEVPVSESTAPLPPGGFVIAEVPGRVYRDVFVLPRDALIDGRLFVVSEAGAASMPEAGPDSEASSRSVTGSRSEAGIAIVERRIPRVRALLSEVVLLDEGVEPGDLVVITNLEQMSDGLRVKVVRERDGVAGNGR
jgi:multidrug efflux pump subunit AcrA (membrane-fusion protein)